jgi:hypothetical protein
LSAVAEAERERIAEVKADQRIDHATARRQKQFARNSIRATCG